ncbi:MAG TPA: sulfatase [Candidatus Polarisedimenticolaceae bacterium]|nr:sulfatase [Candidatus Polarisedimenticolaceae bacterium]
MRPFSAAILPTFGVALVAGALSGLLRAAATLQAEGYADLGMPGLILWTLERSLLGAVLSFVALAAGAVLLFLALDLAAERLRRRHVPPAVLPFVPFVALAAVVPIRRLDRLALVPSLRTVPGMLLATLLFTGGMAALLAAAWRWPGPFARVERTLPRFHPRRLAVLLVLLPLLPLARAAHDRAVRDDGPSVLLITVDTLRADHLGAFGGKRDTSPNIDALAREGVRFDAAIAQWPKTTPSVTSLLTGTYGSRHGVVRKARQRVPAEHLLLPELLREAGYRSAAVLTNGNLGREFGFAQGFDTFRPLGAERAERVSDGAVAWLRSEGGKPGKFFLWLHYLDPHAPYRPPAPYDRMYVGDRFYAPQRVLPLDQDREGGLGSIPFEAALPASQEAAYYVAQYDAEIRYTDAQIGRVLRELEALGLDGNTLVVFTADHGESLGEHDYWFQHGMLPYEDCLRVPLVLRGPKLGPPRVVTAPVELIRILPTVLDYAGLPPSPQAQSQSLLPLLRDPSPRWPQVAYAEAGYADDYQRILRGERYKLVLVPSAEDRAEMAGTQFELYDLAADPGETRNLLAERPEVARALARDLLGWMETAGARGTATGETVALDEHADEQLRSLGYVR